MDEENYIIWLMANGKSEVLVYSSSTSTKRPDFLPVFVCPPSIPTANWSDRLLVMRRDGALNLILNAKLFKGMKFAAGPDPRYVTFTILDEDLKPKSHLLRVGLTI